MRQRYIVYILPGVKLTQHCPLRHKRTVNKGNGLLAEAGSISGVAAYCARDGESSHFVRQHAVYVLTYKHIMSYATQISNLTLSLHTYILYLSGLEQVQ